MIAMSAKYARFVFCFLAFTCTILLPVLLLNFLVDPLWYFSGNRLGSLTESFNTRVSKAILIKRHAQRYDCVIFGPSVTTLLKAPKIRGSTSFNAAFGDARVEELPVYARYLKHLGLHAKTIIVDLTPRNFATTRPRLSRLPTFVEESRDPAPAIATYTSFRAFWFSLKSAMGWLPDPEVYDADFNCHLRPDIKRWPVAKIRAEFESYADFSPDALAPYEELLQVWPDARRVGIVSFIDASASVVWQDMGILDDYLRVNYTASKLFDSYYDFTAPSTITTDPSLSFDGLHYDAPNDLIADRISESENQFGIALHQMTYDDYRRSYLEAMAKNNPDRTMVMD